MRKYKGFILLFLVLTLPLTNALATMEEGYVVSTEYELRSAVENGLSPIVVNNTIEILNHPVEITGNTTIQGTGILTFGGTQWQGSTRWHFIVQGNATLTIAGDITLTNLAEDDRIHGGGVRISNGGVFNMDGGRIYDIFIDWPRQAGVFVEHGVFNMNGGEISDNRSATHGVIYVGEDGIFNMNGGELSRNQSSSGMGGGAVSGSGGVINMNGGKILENSGVSGGGVALHNGIFNMNGGEISNNRVGGWISETSGGGVCLRGGTFTMTGGIISGNHAGANGGGVAILWGSVYISGGEVSGNTAGGNGGGIYLPSTTFGGHEIAGSPSRYMYMSGGRIASNTASRGGGIFLGYRRITPEEFLTDEPWNEIVYAGGIFTAEGGEITANRASSGGAIYVDASDRIDYRNLTIGENVVFRENRAGLFAHNFGLSEGRLAYPAIQWYDANSVRNAHLFNNFDINYTGGFPIFPWWFLAIIVLFVSVVVGTVVSQKMKEKRRTRAVCLDEER